MEEVSTNPVDKHVKVCEKTQKVLDFFIKKVDITQKYSLDEFKKLLSDSYKSSKIKEETDKRPLSKYNIFIKENMSEFKKEHPDKTNKEIMSLIAVKWNETKNNSD